MKINEIIDAEKQRADGMKNVADSTPNLYDCLVPRY